MVNKNKTYPKVLTADGRMFFYNLISESFFCGAPLNNTKIVEIKFYNKRVNTEILNSGFLTIFCRYLYVSVV